jgi:hypothetical protein
MFLKSFPAAIAVITVLALSLPLASALGETAHPAGVPRIARNDAGRAASIPVIFWQRVLDFLAPVGGRGRHLTAISGQAGCEMDPDGRARNRSALSQP